MNQMLLSGTDVLHKTSTIKKQGNSLCFTRYNIKTELH